jgi:hypothetical protein
MPPEVRFLQPASFSSAHPLATFAGETVRGDLVVGSAGTARGAGVETVEAISGWDPAYRKKKPRLAKLLKKPRARHAEVPIM